MKKLERWVARVALMVITASAAAWGADTKKAVTDFNPEEGFKMSERALQGLGVKFAKLEGRSPWLLPAEALVRIKHSTGVYRRYEGWISLALVTVAAKSQKGLRVTSEDLQEGDEVAVTGGSFLRMTDADLNSDTVDSCAH
ncbi:MAG: hypothetical protein NDJ89_13155 [Oligoflexia bacterium]|nr:hypothetical protein [Oligoflexia bacterium]